MTPLLITVDTNLLDPQVLEPLGSQLRDVPHEFAFISLSEREHGYQIGFAGHRQMETMVWGESSWGASNWGGPRPGLFVIGESSLAPDDAEPGRYDVLAGDTDGDFFERVLSIVSDGSFPPVGQRDDLTPGVRRQLRDAMIFEAHVRARRHVLLSNDERAYVRHGKRERLEALGRTKIRTLSEFVSLAARGAVLDLLSSV